MEMELGLKKLEWKLPKCVKADGVEYTLTVFRPQQPVWGRIIFGYMNYEQEKILAVVNGRTSEEAKKRLNRVLGLGLD